MELQDIASRFDAHHSAVETALKKSAETDAEIRARLLEIEQKMISRRGGGGDGLGEDLEAKSWGEIIAKSADYKSLASSQSGKVRIQLQTKATITTGATSGGPLAPSDRKPGPNLLPQRRIRFRDALTPGQTTSTAIEFPRQTTRTNAAAVQANEGDVKPESALAWETVTVPCRTIAHTLPASKQILDDSAMLRSVVDGELRYMLEDVVEKQLLLGSGTGANINGVYTQATTFAAPFTMPSPTMLDVLLLAIAQVQAAGFEPDSITLHPFDAAKLLVAKDAGNNYIGNGPFMGQDLAQLWRVPLISTLAMTQGTFMVGSSVGAQVFDRQETTVEISTEHSDFFARNLVLLRSECRLGLAVYRPTAFVKGTFTTAITAATGA